MDELEVLRKQFSELQQQDNKHSLSERNCIEIVLKLIAMGDVDLLFTVDGKQYVTHKQLQLELEDEILRSGGRINVVDLQPILNVDLKHIEDKLQIILKKDRHLSIVDGEIFASYYLDRICEEIMEMLQEAGKLSTQELASRFSMSTMFLEEVLQVRMNRNKRLRAHIQEGIIYTDVYVRRHKAAIRGVFSAITKPTSISAIFNSYQLHEELALFALRELISEGRVAGTLQGRKLYVPDVYEAARTAYIDNFFKQNGYMVYDTLARYEIVNPREYIRSRHPNGIELKGSYVSQEILNPIEDTIADALSGESWVDVTPLVPPILGNTDISKLVELCPSIVSTPATLILDGHYVVSKGLLDRCVQLLSQDIKHG